MGAAVARTEVDLLRRTVKPDVIKEVWQILSPC
jgi:hypothetical protein